MQMGDAAAEECLPLAHGRQVSDPRKLVLPAGQTAHWSDTGSVPTVPGMHAEKPDGADGLIRDPVGTTTVAVPPPTATCPCGTSVQDVADAFGANNPTGHTVHRVPRPGAVLYLPAAHGTQYCFPAMFWY